MIETGISEFWRLARDLTVLQAVCLVADIDPDSEDAVHCENWRADERPKGYNAVKTAITHAILSGELPATIREIDWNNGSSADQPHGSIDWMHTTVNVSALKGWLVARGFHTGFFFPDDSKPSNIPAYLDPKHPRYAPRLAAAIKVWLAMEDENLRKGKSPKQAMEQWLESRYSELRLIQKNDSQKHGFRAGDINKSAIQEAAKIANWNDDGGTPPTPSK